MTSTHLDLTYEATGFWQHVFTPTAGADGEDWLYKIPAAFGYVLPFSSQPFDVFYPVNRRQRLARFALVRLPQGLYSRVFKRIAAGFTADAFVQAPARLEERFPALCRGRDMLLAPHCRRERLENFTAMLDVLEYVSSQGLTDALLPFRILRKVDAVLRIDGAAVPYTGPMLMQRRADVVFGRTGESSAPGESLHSFDWHQVIAKQHLLWRNRVAIAVTNEILGPRSWGLLHGELKLADTSALSRNFRAALCQLAADVLDAAQQRETKRLLATNPSEPADEYFRFIRREINQERFMELWGSDLSRAT